MIKFEKIPDDVFSRLPALSDVLLADKNVVFAYLFGGLAGGTITPLSDIDIAVYVNDINDLAEYKLDLFCRVSDMLGTAEVDLVILNTAPISLTGRVLQHKQLLLDREPEKRHAYESLTLRKFFDFRIKETAMFKQRYGI